MKLGTVYSQVRDSNFLSMWYSDVEVIPTLWSFSRSIECGLFPCVNGNDFNSHFLGWSHFVLSSYCHVDLIPSRQMQFNECQRSQMSGTSDVRRKARKLGTWYKNSTSIVTLDVFSVILNLLWSSTVPLVSTSKHMKALLLHRGFATLSFRAQASKRIMIFPSMLTLAKQTTTLHIAYASHHPWNVIRLLSGHGDLLDWWQ